MTKTYYTTGDAARDEQITGAVHALMADKQSVTVAAVLARLPAGATVTATELRGIYGEILDAADESLRHEWAPGDVSVAVKDPAELKHDPITGGVLAGPPSKSSKNFDAPRAPEPEKLDDGSTPATPSPKISHADATFAVQAAQRAIVDNRIAVRAMGERVRELRGKLHAAVVAFQSGGRRYTALDQARDFAATSQAERAKRLADVPAELRNKYGKAADFTRKRMQNGPQRGAVSQAGRARTGFVVPGSPAALAQAAARAAAKVQ